MTMQDADHRNRILALKEQKNAVIIAHNYQIPEVQDVADFIGDSLALSRNAAQTKADTILFCGVNFRAETASIICPENIIVSALVCAAFLDRANESPMKSATSCTSG